MHGKADLIRRLAHAVHGDDRGDDRLVTRVAYISKGVDNERESLMRPAKDWSDSIPVLDVGLLRIENERASVCIDERLTLTPFGFIAGAIATQTVALDRLDAVAVEHRSRG